MVTIFNTFIYEPLYNGFIFLITIVPGHSLGLAIILLTLIVKTILLPLAHKQSKSQRNIKKIEPEMRELREKHKDDKQEQARKTMELYQKHGINPFSGCFLMIVQIPIIIALYWVFFRGLKDGINYDILYSFAHQPIEMTTVFLGQIDLMGKSLFLAAIAGIAQFFQMQLAMPALPKPEVDSTKPATELNFKDEFAKTMNTQFRYILPGMVFFFAYTISAAVALYWATSNIFSIIHELYVKREADSLITNTQDNHESR
jgi:YidC/Oxa1 family membrane protein insertase